MKKVLLIAVTAALAASLAGCGGETAAPASPGGEDSAPTQTEEAAASVQEEAPEEQREQAFTSMELEITRGTLYIRAGEEFSLTRHGGEDVDYEIDGDTLYFENDYTGDTVLTLPEEESYDTLRLTVADGHVYAERPLALRIFGLEEKRGEVTMEDLSVTESSDVQIGQGTAFLSGDLGQSAAVSCREGHLSLELPFAQSACNYELDVSEGNLSLGGETFHGRSTSKTIDNGGDRTLELTCSRGDVSVQFGK